jgi:SAM-dependent methyltransferase
MPASIGVFITSALIEIDRLRPESVLDVGCGFGLWGFLCRLYLDVFPGRRYGEDWKIRIEGVEVFPKYIMPHQEFLYDKIHLGKIETVFDELDAFDLYIFGDVLEHLPKQDAVQLLDRAYRKANKGILINVPLGESWLREGTDENEYEAHVSVWELEDFVQYCPKVCGEGTFPELGRYALILIDKTVCASREAYGLCYEGKRRRADDPKAAAECFRRAIEIGYEDPEPHFELADLLLKEQKVDESVEVLRDAIARFPDNDTTYDSLGRLLLALNRCDEANEVLSSKPAELH